MSALKGVINQAYENDFKTQVSNNDISLTQVKHENGEFNEKYVIPGSNAQQLDSKIKADPYLEGDEEDGEVREEWSNQCEFILSTVGYAVGLGNVWRFPYLAYKNGGGSFLIPYVIMLFFAGLPLFFMELVLGQYSRQGPTRVFGRMAPIFKGLGLAMMGATFFVGIYYNMIIGWTLFYMFSGFTSELPWVGCHPNVSSVHCIANTTNTEMGLSKEDLYAVAPPEDFFLHQMLGMDRGMHNWDNVGSVRWQMVLCLLGAWVIVCLCLIKGVQSSGKVRHIVIEFSPNKRSKVLDVFLIS